MAKLNANGVELGSLTTSQRDALSAVAGEVIFNSTDNVAEVYNGSTWDKLSNIFSATGGTKSSTSRSGFIVHTFTSPGTFSVTSGTNDNVEYLVIGGGGGTGEGH